MPRKADDCLQRILHEEAATRYTPYRGPFLNELLAPARRQGAANQARPDAWRDSRASAPHGSPPAERVA